MQIRLDLSVTAGLLAFPRTEHSVQTLVFVQWSVSITVEFGAGCSGDQDFPGINRAW